MVLNQEIDLAPFFGITNELAHSSMIVEFFWFFVSCLTLSIAIIKLIKIGNVHDIPNYTEQPKPQNPSVPVNDPQKDNMKQPQLDNDVNTINIDINNNPSNQEQIPDQAPHVNQNAMEEKQISTLPQQGEGFISTFSKAVDLMVGKHLVIFVIFIYLINHFGCYIYTAFCVFICIIQLILFNYFKMFERLGNIEAQKYSELSYHIWIVTLFIAYFINNQKFDMAM